MHANETALMPTSFFPSHTGKKHIKSVKVLEAPASPGGRGKAAVN